MPSRSQLFQEFAALHKQAVALRAVLVAEIAATSGRSLAIARLHADKFREAGARGQSAQAVSSDFFRTLGMPIPGNFRTEAALQEFNQNLSDFLKIRDQMAVIWGILNPTHDFTLLAFAAVLAITGIGALATAALEGATAAGAASAAAGTGAAAAAAAPAAGAAIGTTAAVGAGATAAAVLPTVTIAAPAIAAPALAAPALAAVGTGAVAAAASSAESSAASSLAHVAASESTVQTVASTVGSELTKLTGSSTVGNLAQGVIGQAGSLITDFEKFIAPLLKYGKDVLDEVTAIDNKYIIPLTTNITKTYDTISGTISTVQTLAHEGLQGILAIPQAVSSAFSALSSGALKAAEITLQGQQSIANDTLVPGITKGVGEPVAAFADLYSQFTRPELSAVGQLPKIAIPETFDKSAIDDVLEARVQTLVKNGGIGDLFAAGLLTFVQGIVDIIGPFEGILAAGSVKGLNDLRPEPLSVGEALELYKRQVLGETETSAELGNRGYADQRIAALKELTKWLPAEDRAIMMFLRSIISSDDLKSILAKKGMSDQDQEALRLSMLEPVNPREVIAANGRQAMKEAGWLPHSLGTDVPGEFKAMYEPRLANPAIATLDWLEHWKIPNIEWWFVAYFRKLVTKDDVVNAAKAENWPVEVIDKMFSVRQELLQQWMLPDILAAGVMTEQEAQDYLSYAGVEQRSAQILIDWAKSKGKATDSARALSLADKFEASAKAMFQDGLINGDEYNLLLLNMGFNTEQAALMVGLAQHEVDIASRKSFAALLEKRVLTGQMTLQDMQSELLGQGFTSTEVKNYVGAVTAAQSDQTKFPSTVEIVDFMKKGFITPGQAAHALKVQGWSQFWIPIWLQYGGLPLDQSTAATNSAF